MAEFIMKYLVQQAGLENQFVISSAATSTKDYEDWDFIIAMDQANLSNIRYVVGHDPKKKVRLLMSFTDAGENRSISAPWYTRDFARAYNDIYQGCESLLNHVKKFN